MTTPRDIIAAVDRQPTAAAYALAARQLRLSSESRRRVKLAMLSSFTIELLAPYLEVATARLDFAADIYVAPFDNVHQELLTSDSGCLRHEPEVVFVIQELASVCPEIVDEFLDLPADEIERMAGELVSSLRDSLSAFRRRSTAMLVVHNFALPTYPLLGVQEASVAGSQSDAIRMVNRRLAEAVRTIPGAYVLDFDRVTANVGYRNARDERLWHLARAPLSAALMRELAREQAAYVHALTGVQRKCLVLDLDNTLWGGVVGEAGADGIALGATYPGSAFRQFQQAVQQLSRRGVLLAINSKNNADEAGQIIRSHPGMVLRAADFAASRINWREKSQNMIELAEELNIGLESMVFVDDDPAERARMRQALPAVFTIEMPADPTRYAEALLDSRLFERVSLTDEDLRRTDMYREQRVREQARQASGTVEDFLKSLEMKVAIQPVDAASFPRVVDLLHKTNQFNLTSRRYPAAAVAEMMEDARHGVFHLHARDRFGDNGIVGVAIVERVNDVCRIDTLLLSCRVIGRSLETALLAYLAEWARGRGASVLEGEFVPTAKNAPAADVYRRHGFTRVNEDTETEWWRLPLSKSDCVCPAYIQGAPTVEQLT